jgi:phage-related protein
MGSSLADLRKLSEDVKDVFGFALHQAQLGARHIDAKPLKGFGGAGVLEVLTDDRGGTYRLVYTVKLRFAVYVLHVFQKKSKTGIRTPEKEIRLIVERLKLAARHHEEFYEQTKSR